MNRIAFPVIDPVATGENIRRLRRERGLTVRDLQAFFGFEEPQAIYKWQRGKSLPSVDNLYALSVILDVSMDDIIVSRTIRLNQYNDEQQAAACCSAFLHIEVFPLCVRYPHQPSVTSTSRIFFRNPPRLAAFSSRTRSSCSIVYPRATAAA